MRIIWSVRSSDTSTILTCLQHIWTESPTHNTGIKKSPVSLCSVAGDIDVDPSASNLQYYIQLEYVKPVLALFRR